MMRGAECHSALRCLSKLDRLEDLHPHEQRGENGERSYKEQSK
jgi:hypothetical protein